MPGVVSSGDGGSGATDAASCQTAGPGLTNCGASSESCCTSLEVAGGTYYRTYDLNDAGQWVLPPDGGPTGVADPATVSPFRLDKYLVTVGRFRQFVDAVLPPDGGAGWLPAAGSGKHTHLNGGLGLVNSGAPADAGTVYETGWSTTWNSDIAPTNANLACSAGWDTWTDTAGSHETLPIDCVTWYEAYAFCIWDGGFLPSEAEWEHAAAGGSQQLEYPWGSTAPGTVCPGTGCEYAIYDCNYPSGEGPSNCNGEPNIAPVGTARLGAGLWGQLDLAGELWEWNLDVGPATYVDPCTDCAFLTATSFRVLRGGLFYLTASSMHPSTRNGSQPSHLDGDFGFRCARTP